MNHLPTLCRRLLGLAAVFSALLAAPASGQAGAEVAGDAPAAAILVVENRPIVTFRVPFGNLSPEQRVADSARRIAAVEDPVTRKRIQAAPIADGVLVSVDDEALFVLVPGDLDPVLDKDLDAVRERAVANLARALAERAERRQPAVLLRAAGRAAVATLIVLVVLVALARIRGFLARRLRRSAEERLSRLEVLGVDPLHFAVVFARLVVGLAFWSASLFAAYAWLAYVLESFPYTRPLGEALGGYLTTTLWDLGLGVLEGLPNLLTAIFIFVLTRLVARLVTTFFKRVEARELTVSWSHPETARATRWIVVSLCWTFGLIFAYPYLPGSGSEAFRGVGVVVGLMVSLGSTGLVNQVMAGLVLIYSRALRSGEYVRVGTVEGTVTDLGLLSTKVVTPRRQVITIPNSVVVADTTRNDSRLTAEIGVFVSTAVSLGYDVPWRQAHALLLAAAAEVEGLRREPPPVVRQRSLGDFAVRYQLNARMDRPLERPRILSDLHGRIQDLFNTHGVQILSPHFHQSPAEPVVVRESEWFEPPGGPDPGRPDPGGPDPAAGEREPLENERFED